MMRLIGKVAIITGAGQGIGRMIAMRLAAEGASVVIGDVNTETAWETAQEIETKGGNAVSIKLDVTKRNDVEEITRLALEKFGKIDILVNNAGIYPNSPIVDMKEEEWDLVMDINLKGTFLCSQAAARQMIIQGKGVIINIASVDAKTRTLKNAHYAASKAGVISFTRTLAGEVAEHHIRVNAVSPGWIANDPSKVNTQRWQEAIKDIPVGRLGTPNDVAEAVLFLVSDAASYITGEVLDVNGGMVMD